MALLGEYSGHILPGKPENKKQRRISTKLCPISDLNLSEQNFVVVILYALKLIQAKYFLKIDSVPW